MLGAPSLKGAWKDFHEGLAMLLLEKVCLDLPGEWWIAAEGPHADGRAGAALIEP